MKRSGRASLVVVIMAALVAAVAGLFLLAGESPTAVTGKFLTALAKGDAKTLASLSFMDGLPEAEIEKKWQETHDASKFWTFAYQIQDSNEQDANTATVRLQWIKNAMSGSAYEEKYELPLLKVGGKWKVDVRGISREMYPSLPR
ncbi:MAG: DUF4878 domain-containing protein [Chlorobia bacterium]|nr:DUF4878 domain-containing protein [Fimbriimonadaceae bacterium]